MLRANTALIYQFTTIYFFVVRYVFKGKKRSSVKGISAGYWNYFKSAILAEKVKARPPRLEPRWRFGSIFTGGRATPSTSG